MNAEVTKQPCRREFRYFVIYRTLMCCIACCALFTAGAIKLSGCFTPENLKNIVLSQQSGYEIPASLAEDEVMNPGEGFGNEKIYVIEEPVDTPSQKAASGDDGIYPITEIDLSSGAGRGEVLIRDTDSNKSVEIEALLHSDYPYPLRSSGITTLSAAEEPLVLILHTHATECYTEAGQNYYSADTSFRSTDTSKNMVAIGKVMSDILNGSGIATLHCTTLHDAEDYNQSYSNSLKSLKSYLLKYPSIKYIFDVHRDAMIRDTGEALKPVCEINGTKAAQVMTLVGTDAGGADHPQWRENNMNLAIKLQFRLTSEHNGLARPINTRNASFNQQYAPGSLLFEVGSCANTLDEAKTAAEILAKSISEVILSNS